MLPRISHKYFNKTICRRVAFFSSFCLSGRCWTHPVDPFSTSLLQQVFIIISITVIIILIVIIISAIGVVIIDNLFTKYLFSRIYRKDEWKCDQNFENHQRYCRRRPSSTCLLLPVCCWMSGLFVAYILHLGSVILWAVGFLCPKCTQRSGGHSDCFRTQSQTNPGLLLHPFPTA